jgi:TonB family protein
MTIILGGGDMNKNKKGKLLGMIFLLAAAGSLAAVEPGQDLGMAVRLGQWEMKLRVFEGVKEGAVEPTKVVTASFLKYTFSATIESELELEAEREQVRKVFNLKEVRLLTESELSWKEGLPETVAQVFRLDHKEYQVRMTTARVVGRMPFRIEVFEQGEKEKVSLLDTEFNLTKTKKNFVVFGFENSQGQPYFISLRILGFAAEAGAKGEPVKFLVGVVPPKLIKSVNPIYPEEAKKAGIEGIVILEATTDEYGRVVDVKVVKSVDPTLDQAALDAVKQWVYEPKVIDGKRRGITFTATVRFTLDKDKSTKGGVEAGVKGGVEGGVLGGAGKEEIQKKLDEFAKGAVPCKGDIEPPKLLKEVLPVYPEEARKNGIEGIVILSARTDEYGRVADTFILRSIPSLDEAAQAAVKQWVYEPMLINGKATPVLFTVTVRFQLDGKGKKGSVETALSIMTAEDAVKKELLTDSELREFAQGAVVVKGDADQPKKVYSVPPQYPHKARMNRVEGVVILLVKIDAQGLVVAQKTILSIPVLDQGAIDAVKQWKYEPLMKDGKPVPAVFPVTISFKLS